MIHLTYSNRTEALFEHFARDLAASRRGAGLFDPARLVVPNRNVETWLKRELARRDGIAANFEVLQLRRFVNGLVERADPGLRLVDSDLMQDLLLSVLLDEGRLAAPGLLPVREYLHAGGESADAVDLRRVQLATQLARLFEEYAFSRPEMLEAWRKGPTLTEPRWARTEAWQRALWLEIFGEGGLLAGRAAASGERFQTLPQVVAALPAQTLAGGRPVFLFGVSYVASLFQQVLARLAAQGELHVYTLNPCQEYWEDLLSGREAVRRASLEGEDPFRLAAHAGDPPALVLWGRPGRENIRLLDRLSQCDFREAFLDPVEERRSLLAWLQRDILVRAPERLAPDASFDFEGDASVRFLACPGVRREAEAIAQEIWARVKDTPGLRFTDVAVMVAGREPETYFTHLRSAFEEGGFEIPYTLEATALSAQSRVAEAAELLLALPFGRASRAEVLRVVTHPAVAARFPDADPQEWVRWCDDLGVFHGVDREDHRGSYLDLDVHSWDQGLRRLALGAAMTGGRSNDARAFVLGDERYLPEERSGSSEASAAGFGRLVRSLLADGRFARAQALTLPEWADFLSRLLETYLVPRADERLDLERCLAAVRGLAELELEGRRVSFRVAGELARAALAGLRRGVSRRSDDEGVALSTLQPMRALPFKLVFVAGLGEGRFPAADRRSELDLRGARPRAGDVSPREQDQYMFLETLLCARERLVLSYVSRNELTGEPVPPSPVVIELQRILDRGYLGAGGSERRARKVPLRRFEEERERLPLPPEAQAERGLRALRRAVEPAVGAVPLEPEMLRTLLPEEALPRIEAGLRGCRVPARAALEPKSEAPLRVRLADLRRFLECPLQGAARFLLRLEEDEEDRALVEDEPFEGGRLEQTVGQRQVFLQWLREGRAAEFAALVEPWAAPRIAAGRLPASFLWALERDSFVAGPRIWREQLEALGVPARRVEVHRFGPASEGERVDVRHDPLPLVARGPDGAPLRVEIVGTTGTLLDDGAGELVLQQRRRGNNKALERARRHAEALGAFLDHAAFAAAGLRGEGFNSIQLYDHRGEGDRCVLRFHPLDSERAREWLASLASDLLVVREHLLPAVAVFAWEQGLAPTYAEALDEVIERGHFASEYGPVRNAAAYGPPLESVARELVDRRYGLFQQSVEELEGPEEGEAEPPRAAGGKGGRP